MSAMSRSVLSLFLLGVFVMPAYPLACAQDALIPGVQPLTTPNPMIPRPAEQPRQGTYHLTLEDARQRALATSQGLGLANLGIMEKREGVAAAKTDYLPKLLGNVTYLHFDSDLGVVNTVRTGQRGILPPSTRSVAVNILNQDGSLTSMMLAQPITKLIAVNAAVKLAKADEEIARAQLAQGTRDLLTGVTQAFYGLHGVQRVEQALRLQVGYIEQVSRASASPEIRVGLIEARQALNQVHGQAADITEQLNQLVGLPAGTFLILEDPLPPAPPVHSADEAAQLAVSCHPKVKEAMATLQKADAAMQVAKADFLPDFMIFGAYFNQTSSPLIQSNFGALGVTGSYTFVDWGKRRHVKHQREFQIAQARRNIQDTIDKIVLEARKAYAAFELSAESLNLADEMVKARKEGEESAKAPPEIQAAKTATAKAELEQLQAEASYRVAHAKLMEMIGTP